MLAPHSENESADRAAKLVKVLLATRPRSLQRCTLTAQPSAELRRLGIACVISNPIGIYRALRSNLRAYRTPAGSTR